MKIPIYGAACLIAGNVQQLATLALHLNPAVALLMGMVLGYAAVTVGALIQD